MRKRFWSVLVVSFVAMIAAACTNPPTGTDADPAAVAAWGAAIVTLIGIIAALGQGTGHAVCVLIFCKAV